MNGVRKYLEDKDIKKFLDLLYTAVWLSLFSLLHSLILSKERVF